MEKETIAIAGAIVGASCTTAAALVLRRLELAKLHQHHAAEVGEAERVGYARGWLEGCNKLLREYTGESEVFPSLVDH
jgi:hypothetical protein